MGELSDNEQEGPTSISVFCRAMDGDESGEMKSPGVEKIHQILEDADLKVNVNVIWDIYKENEWEPHTSFDQAKFTTLWTAVVSVAETIPSNEQGGEIVLSDQHTDEPKVEEKSANGAKQSQASSSNDSKKKEEKMIEAQVQALLKQMCEKHLADMFVYANMSNAAPTGL